MNGCTTCGGFGNRHDPIAHGTAPRGCRGWEWGLCNGIDCPECNGGGRAEAPGADGMADPMTGYECADCGVAGMDISQEGVDPDFWFECGDDGVMRCQGCEAIQSANRRFGAGDW